VFPFPKKFVNSRGPCWTRTRNPSQLCLRVLGRFLPQDFAKFFPATVTSPLVAGDANGRRLNRAREWSVEPAAVLDSRIPYHASRIPHSPSRIPPETVPLEQAADDYARMMRGKARFRMVLIAKGGVANGAPRR
jgi:hypothetical protein